MRIDYALPQDGRVNLRVFDTAGRLVETLVDKGEAAGEHAAVWHARDGAGRPVESGIYYLILEASGEVVRHRACVIE
jgi:flagellar hook assembly protein FlgD